MKRFLFFFGCAINAMFLFADTYNYLVFKDLNGNNTALTITNLTMSVNDNALYVTNNDGMVNFSLPNLRSMQFSENGEITSVDSVLNANQPIRVFSPIGLFIGKYDNLLQAVKTLEKGAYIISNIEGKKKQKILVQ